jgi:hypothetical protein
MKIGLIGEAPHDTNCIKELLARKYPNFEFITLINNIHGSQLDQPQPTKRILRIEYQLKKPDLVIVIRDLDGLAHEITKRKKRIEVFNSYKSVVDKKAIFLLHIFEIEALILADIQKFATLYNCSAPNNLDPCSIKNPKEYLKSLSKKYNEVKNIELFKLLEIDTLRDKCAYFNSFLNKMHKLVE